MAGETGLEPAAFCVTGRRYNQLNYSPGDAMSDKYKGEPDYRQGQILKKTNFAKRHAGSGLAYML